MTTLSEKITLRGIGLHTGAESEISLNPYDKKGIFFRFGRETVKATAETVCDTSRCTMLNLGGHIVQTCEHLLGVIYALGIDSVLIENSSDEIPIFDGSGKMWCEVLKDKITGKKDCPATIKEKIKVSDGDAFIEALPSNAPEIEYHLDYSHPMIGKSSFVYTPEKFEEYIAPSRTFALFEEVEFLRKNGLAKGGSEENCIIVFPDRISVPLRHREEFATHKILDLLGDMSLIGASLDIKINACKSGHRLNNIFAKKLRTVIDNA